MASVRIAKRPRTQTNADDRAKRPRHSERGDNDDESSSENASRHPEDEDMVDDDDDPNFARHTQRIERQLRDKEHRQNTPAESGIIEEIQCTNFMCHEKLTVPLGPLINFIIGHNGSGKSAVLTALTLCLGGKAAATNRGHSLKAFIKEGRDSCVISVKIKNQGPAAYRPDEYGKSIIVERHFSHSTSGFKLKDANGKIVSTKKQNLEDIIDAFALQIDNPMNVLTQDMARQFLNDSNPKLKYKFFLKGTQLQTLNEDYQVISRELDESQQKSQTISSDIQILFADAQKAIKKAKRAHNLEAMRAREVELLHQVAWAAVQEEEEELATVDVEIANVSRVIEERNAKADEHSQEFAHAERVFSELNQAIEDRQAERVPLEEEIKEFQIQFGETRKELMKQRTSQRELGGRISGTTTKIKKYENEIEEHRRRQAEADGGQHSHLLEQLQVAKESYEHTKEELENHDSNLQSLNDELNSARAKKRPTDEKLEKARDEVRQCEQGIRDLEQGQGDWTASYQSPGTLRNLMKAIEGEARFRQRPVGPMGRHVKLLDPVWGSILEKQSGGTLNGFVVTSKADQNILSELMRRTNHQCPIFIGSEMHINTTAHEPLPDLTTWMRVLNIDNDLVRNQMIVNHMIDQVVLVRERTKGQKFMHDGGVQRKNVKVCFTMADNDPYKGHSITINSSGSISIGPIAAFNGRSRMHADKGAQLAIAKNNLDRAKRLRDSLESEARALQGAVDECQRRMNDHERHKKKLRQQFQNAQREVERLENELNDAEPDEGRLDQLKEQLLEAKETKTLDEGQYEDIVVKIDKLNSEAATQKAALEEVQKRVAQLNVELGKAQDKAAKAESKRQQALHAKNNALEAVEAATNNKGDWEQQRGKKLNDVEESTSQAEQICARVEVPAGETSKSLERTRERLQKDRAESEKELGGSEAELVGIARVAKQKHEKAKKELDEIDKVLRFLRRSLVERQRRWEKFRRDISTQARITFGYLLSERQFRGTLKVDHKSQQLDIHVQPDTTVSSGAGRQTKTLSGGEKSFSTICLLLSLWEAMGSPIRCLDEFDVFMDSVNRDISMKMMISAARRAIGRQFILITPQAMNNFQSGGDVKIIRMSDPERGQTALNVGA